MSLQWRYTNLEQGTWTPESGPSINPDPPADFQLQNARGELQIYLRGAAGIYGGALAKGVHSLPAHSEKLQFSAFVRFDEALLEYGQVLEMDTKFTDFQGFTYPGDFQILVSSGQPQIGNPWFNWGEPLVLHTDIWQYIEVLYELDYIQKTIRINGSEPIPAVQEGWTPSELVVQLQLCSNSKAGFHTVRYKNITVGTQEGE